MSDEPTAATSLRFARLAAIPLFAGLAESCLRALEAALAPVLVRAGAVLIQQGDAGDELFVILHGRFAVDLTDAQGAVRRVGEVGSGEIVGEMAMLTAAPRATTVRALRDSEVGRMSRAKFEELAGQEPLLYRRLAALLGRRLDAANRRVPPVSVRKTIVLVPHRPNSALDQMGAALTRVLEGFGPVLALTRAQAEAAGLTSTEALLAWLAPRERDHRFVLFVADAGAGNWNRLCVAQADTVLVVGRGTDAPEPGPVEASLPRELPAPRELVLLHAPGTTPSGTRFWLQPGRFTRHHHLREADPADLARLGRRLANRAVALVCGGGGARGFAHIGVVRALHEAGLPIDLVAGTSMGSLMSAQIALGWTWEEMLARNRKVFWNDPLKGDNTLPLVSLLTCRKVVQTFVDLYGESRAEDAWLPWFCVSCNLTRAELKVHREGLLWQAVRSSSALPGIGPPVVENGEFIVDGAVLDNLPAGLMRAEQPGAIIAVNVSPKEDLRSTLPATWELSGWRLLWDRWRGRPGAPEFPSMLWVIQRTVLLGAVASAERMRGEVELYLHPPVGDYEMFGWRRIEEIAQVGYDYAKATLAAPGAWRPGADGSG